MMARTLLQLQTTGHDVGADGGTVTEIAKQVRVNERGILEHVAPIDCPSYESAELARFRGGPHGNKWCPSLRAKSLLAESAQ